MSRYPRDKQPRTPVIAGVFFCLLTQLVSCEEKGTPQWQASHDSAPPEERATSPAARPAESASSFSPGFRFVSYNVRNWLVMDRHIEKTLIPNSPKPESERQAAIAILASQKPDVIGLCEIGTKKDLQEIQSRLASSGINLPHLHYTGGTDEVRHLGLLSRFPITATAQPAKTSFRLRGMNYGINRGVLDTTLSIGSTPFRFLGVHLKSKREIEGADQEEMRLHEAKLLRSHIDSIFAADSKARLIVYGDFNDTRPTHTIRSVTGGYTDPGYLTAIPFQDSAATYWTHYWKPHDIYARIDFVFVSRELRRQIDFKASRIVDHPQWQEASDHRPLLTIFRTGK